MGLLKLIPDSLKILTIAFLCFTAGVGLGKEIIHQYEGQTFKPWGWQKPPLVLNCYGERLSPNYIDKSVDYWIMKGEEILFVEHKPIKSLCKKRNIIANGVIKIYEGKDITFDSESTLGLTKRKASITTGMVGANIYIRSGHYTIKNLLTHEMGHALGYTHVNIRGHIMHPLTELMGDKFWIP